MKNDMNLLNLPLEIVIQIIFLLGQSFYVGRFMQLNKLMQKNMQNEKLQQYWKILIEKNFKYRKLTDSKMNYQRLYQYYFLNRQASILDSYLRPNQVMLFNKIRENNLPDIVDLGIKPIDFYCLNEDKSKNPMLVASILQRQNILDYFFYEVVNHTFKNNSQDILGFTKIHWAAGCNIISEIKNASNADLTKKSKRGFTPLFIAAQMGHYEIVKYLIQKLSTVSNFNINDKDNQEGATALFVATFNGHLKVVELLLENGADVNITSIEGSTPFHAAAYEGNNEILLALIENAKNIGYTRIDDRDKNKQTPLFIAASQGNYEIVQTLMKNKVDIFVADKHGRTPLFIASENGFVQIVDLLILNKGDVNKACNNYKETPIFAAAKNGHLDVVRRLLKAGANIYKMSHELFTPLLIASVRNYSLVVGDLIKNYKWINQAPTDYVKSLYVAAKYGYYQTMKVLTEASSSNTSSLEYLTSFLIAVKHGHLNLVNTFIEKGIDINHRSSDGSTALTMAILTGNLDMVETLLNAKASLTLCYKDKTPLELAIEYNQPKIVTLMNLWQVKLKSAHMDVLEQIKQILAAPTPMEDKECDSSIYTFFSNPYIKFINTLYDLTIYTVEGLIKLLEENSRCIAPEKYDFIFKYIFGRNSQPHALLEYVGGQEDNGREFAEDYFGDYDDTGEPYRKYQKIDENHNSFGFQ